jgi:hypothetical protein
MVNKGKKSKAPGTERLAVVVTLKGSTAWKAWLDRLADVCRTDTSKLIDMALVEFARNHGFEEEAPRR